MILKSQTFEILNNSLKKIIFNFSILNSYSQMSFSRVRGCGPIHGTEMMMTHLLIDESILFELMNNSDNLTSVELEIIFHHFCKSDIDACQIRFNVIFGAKLSSPFNIR